MMNKWYPEWGVSKRKQFYYELIQYWSGVLDTQKPDAIVFLEIPHEMYSFVLYALAKLRSIKTPMFENILSLTRLTLYDDYKVGNLAVVQQAQRGFNTGVHVQLKDLKSIRGCSAQEVASMDAISVLESNVRQQYKGWNHTARFIRAIIMFVRDGSLVMRVFKRTKRFFGSDLKREYERLERDPDLDQPYVYLWTSFSAGAHNQPTQAGYLLIRIIDGTNARGEPTERLAVIRQGTPGATSTRIKLHTVQISGVL